MFYAVKAYILKFVSYFSIVLQTSAQTMGAVPLLGGDRALPIAQGDTRVLPADNTEATIIAVYEAFVWEHFRQSFPGKLAPFPAKRNSGSVYP